MKNVFAFGDECSDISDCNSDSCDCYGSDKEYLRTRVRRVDGNIILTRLKFLQNRRRKFMPLLYSDESESESDKAYPPLLLFIFLSLFTSTKDTEGLCYKLRQFGDCDSSESECAYKYSSDSSDSSDSFEYRRQQI
jgi:hypothetical protein